MTEPISPPSEIAYDDFAKLDLRVATIVAAEPHPNADRLLKLQIELSDGQRRQICAGIRAFYDPAVLVGSQVVVVANLAPRKLRGEESHGMLLAATHEPTGAVVLIRPESPVQPGSGVH